MRLIWGYACYLGERSELVLVNSMPILFVCLFVNNQLSKANAIKGIIIGSESIYTEKEIR